MNPVSRWVGAAFHSQVDNTFLLQCPGTGANGEATNFWDLWDEEVNPDKRHKKSKLSSLFDCLTKIMMMINKKEVPNFLCFRSITNRTVVP